MVAGGHISLVSTLAVFATCCWAVVVKRTEAYTNPSDGGGSMLIDAGNGYGEPLNVIISGLSSPDVLTDDGFLNYARSIGLSTQCLGIQSTDPFSANLGDGNGIVNQTLELREDYGNVVLGTCWESLIGGNHLRMFRQNGSDANTGALFLAISQEESLSEYHTISTDGYDVGRDEFVGNATAGTTSYNGVSYTTTEEDITGLLSVGSSGINHDITIDGVVKLLTITIS